MTQKLKTRRDKKYVDSFKIPGEHRCLITRAENPDGAHIRYGFAGLGIKPGDDMIIPLAHHLHAKQHEMGEVSFWQTYGIAVGAKVGHYGEWVDDFTLMNSIKDIARRYYADWRTKK